MLPQGVFCNKLATLDELIQKHGFNILNFNQEVKQLTKDLSARGEKSNDLNYNLMKAYKEVPGQLFVMYIQSLVTLQDTEGDLQIEDLMERVEGKYNTLKDDGEWNAQSKQDKEILALKAEISRIKNKIPQKKRGGGNSSNPKSPKKKKVAFDRTKEPKDPSKPFTDSKGKKWYWCGKSTGGQCEMMRLHKPEDCKGPGGVPNSNPKGNEKGNKTEDQPKRSGKNFSKKSSFKNKLKLKKAYAKATFTHQEDSDSDSQMGTEVDPIWGEAIKESEECDD